jgi:hypothetical protein
VGGEKRLGVVGPDMHSLGAPEAVSFLVLGSRVGVNLDGEGLPQPLCFRAKDPARLQAGIFGGWSSRTGIVIARTD